MLNELMDSTLHAHDLAEGIKSTREKYLDTDKISQREFDAIEEADPTKTKKYMDWIAGILTTYPEDVRLVTLSSEIAPRIKQYDTLVNKNIIKGSDRDIYTLGWEHFVDVVQEHAGTLSKTEAAKRIKKEGADQIFDNDIVTVFEIYTHDAMQYYGAGTRWCITEDDPQYWNQYCGENADWFYVAIFHEDMTDDTDEDELLALSGEKYCLQFKDGDNSVVVWDESDNSLGDISEQFVAQLQQMGVPFSDKQPSEVEAGELEPEFQYEAWQAQYWENTHDNWAVWWRGFIGNIDSSLYETEDGDIYIFDKAIMTAVKYGENSIASVNLMGQVWEMFQEIATGNWYEPAGVLTRDTISKISDTVENEETDEYYSDIGFIFDDIDDELYEIMEYLGLLKAVDIEDSDDIAKVLSDYVNNVPNDLDSRAFIQKLLSYFKYSDVSVSPALSTNDLQKEIDKAVDAYQQDHPGAKSYVGQKEFSFERLLEALFSMWRST